MQQAPPAPEHASSLDQGIIYRLDDQRQGMQQASSLDQWADVFWLAGHTGLVSHAGAAAPLLCADGRAAAAQDETPRAARAQGQGQHGHVQLRQLRGRARLALRGRRLRLGQGLLTGAILEGAVEWSEHFRHQRRLACDVPLRSRAQPPKCAAARRRSIAPPVGWHGWRGLASSRRRVSDECRWLV
eukprot:scaffold26291_cov57-Phaeocystis_antarctica.AAC.7